MTQHQKRLLGNRLDLILVLILTPVLFSAEGDRSYKEAKDYTVEKPPHVDPMIDKYCAVIESDPYRLDNINTLNSLAGLYSNAGKYASAVEIYKTIISKYPANQKGVIQAYQNLSVLYFKTKKTQASRQVLDEFLHMDTQGPQWDRIRSHLNIMLPYFVSTLVAVTMDGQSNEASFAALVSLKEDYNDVPVVIEKINEIINSLEDEISDDFVQGESLKNDVLSPINSEANINHSANQVSLKLLNMLSHIPSVKELYFNKTGPLFQVHLRSATTEQICERLLKLGVPVSSEINLSIDNAMDMDALGIDMDEFFRVFTKKSHDHTGVMTKTGPVITWNQSPIHKMTKSFKFDNMSRIDMLHEICEQIRAESGLENFGFYFFDLRISAALEKKISLDCFGNVYEVLNEIVKGEPRLCWLLTWKKDEKNELFGRITFLRAGLNRQNNDTLIIEGKKD